MKRTLLSYSSVAPRCPCFVIPVFSVPDRNAACVQDLDAFGLVARFLPFDTEHFYTIPVMAASASVEIGDPGLLGFWNEEDEVIIGNADEIRNYLRCVDEDNLPPFAALEAMTLLGDTPRLTRVISRASKLLKDDRARESLKFRVLSRSSVEEEVRQQQRLNEDEQDFHLTDILRHLEAPLSPFDWNQEWRKALATFGNREELRGIAEWRLLSEGLGEYEGGVLTTMLSRWTRPFRDEEFGYRWLDKNINLDDHSWTSVWSSLRYRYNLSLDKYFSLGLTYLGAVQNEKFDRVVSWGRLSLWRWLWREGVATDQLIEIASAMPRRKVHIDHYMEIVGVDLLRSKQETTWLIKLINRWLEDPKSTNAWVYIFIEAERFNRPEDHLRSGVYWLQRLGRGSNQWIKLWENLRSRLHFDLWSHLAELWLLSARTDLRSWTLVFEALHQARGMFVTHEMRAAAQRFLNDRGGKKRHQLIEEVATLPDDRLIEDRGPGISSFLF